MAMIWGQRVATEIHLHIPARASHSSRVTGRSAPDIMRPSAKSFMIWMAMAAEVPVQLSWPQEPHHGDLQARPERFHKLADGYMGWLDQGMVFLGQHVPHSPFPTHARLHGQLVYVMRPSHRGSLGGQHKKLPAAYSSCGWGLFGCWTCHFCAGPSSSMCKWL